MEPAGKNNSKLSSFNRTIVFNCTDAWAPICIFLHVSGQNESVQLKPIGTLYLMECYRASIIEGFLKPCLKLIAANLNA